MEGLPTPLSRVELYLAKAAGMDVTPPEPKSRLELFLAKIAGMDVEMPAPLSLKEMWLAQVAGSAPIEPLAIEGAFYIDNQKVDVRYLAVAAGVIGATLPEKPQNRKEQYWAVIASGGPIVGVLKYVTGTNITLTDVVSGIEELQFVYGDTYQQTYSGKNLFKPQQRSSASNGITSTVNADNSISCTGTATNTYADITAQIAVPVAVPSGTTVTFSIAEAVPVTLRASFGGVWVVINAGSTSGTNTTTANSGNTYMSSNITNGTTYDFTIKNPMIEVGSTATSYEPYTGGIPAPNPDYPQAVQTVSGAQTVTISDGVISQSYGIDLTGKNLWNPNNVLVGYELNSSGVTNANAQRNTLDYTEASAETTYVISGAAFKRVCFYNSSKTFISTLVINSDTFTTPVNTKYFRIAIDNTTSFSEAQIEEGSTATPYAPYYNYELCKIGTYQDYIYKSGDDWYVHKALGKVVFDGSESWSGSTAEVGRWNVTGTGSAVGSSTTNYILSDKYIARYAIQNGSIFLSNNAGRISIVDTTHASLSDWKTWLGTNNVTVYFRLATPTDTQITDATLVGQLNAIDSAVLPKPVAYITVGATDPNLPAPIKISYYGESE